MTEFQGPRCETCKFGLFEAGDPKGLCRRYPPPVPAHGFVARARKKAARNPEARPYVKAPDADSLFVWLRTFADHGQRAAQHFEIKNQWGGGGLRVLRELVASGRIVVFVGLHNWRVMEFKPWGDRTLPSRTALPTFRWRPYLMVNSTGRFYWDGKQWVQR